MKTTKLFLVVFLFLALGSVSAQKINDDKVPEDVFISFKYKFPEATVTSWELNADIYTAKFKLNDQVGKADFNSKGLWLITKYEVAEKELPSPILTYYKDNYRDKDYVISVSELQKTSGGDTFYYILIKKQGFTAVPPVELFYDLTGKLIKKVEAGDNKGDNDQKQDAKEDQKKDSKQDAKQNQKKDGKQDQKKDSKVDQKQEHKKDAKQDEEIDAKQEHKKEVKKDNKEDEEVTEVPQKTDDGDKDVVDAAKIPAVIKTYFVAKAKKAAGAVWYLRDKKYIVKYTQVGKAGQMTFTKEGVWLETRIEQAEESLIQMAVDYLKSNYRTYKIKTMELVSQPKDKTIFIRMYDKRSKELPPPITEIQFTTTGKFINVEKPDEVDQNYNDSQKRKEEKDKEFVSDVDRKGAKYENADNYNDKIELKEVPSNILQYIKQNYKDDYIKSSRLVSDDKLGNTYVIGVKPEIAKYTTYLYFDITGKFIKKYNEGEDLNKKDEDGESYKQTKEEPASKYGTSDERVKATELPPIVPKYLKKNFPQHSISESFFKTDKEMGSCYLVILKKSGDKKVVKVYFDLDGNMLKKETEN